jgi:hypothetical protein
LKLGFFEDYDFYDSTDTMDCVSTFLVEGEDPDITEFTRNYFSHLSLRAGVETPDEFLSLPCKDAAENARRNRVELAFAPSAATFVFEIIEPEDWSESISVTSGAASLVESFEVLMALEAALKNDLCQGQNFSVTNTWTASATSTSGGDSATEDFSCTNTVTVTLS